MWGEDEYQLNSLIDQVNLSKENMVKILKRPRSKERTKLINERNRDLNILKKKLKPYFEWNSKTYQNGREAALIEVINYYGYSYSVIDVNSIG